MATVGVKGLTEQEQNQHKTRLTRDCDVQKIAVSCSSQKAGPSPRSIISYLSITSPVWTKHTFRVFNMSWHARR